MRWLPSRLALWISAAGVVAGAAGLIAGCAPRDRLQRADAEVLAEVRGEILSRDPRAAVGIVTQVLPADRYAAIDDIQLDTFRVGETLIFIDAAQRRLTYGEVRRITSTQLHVQYQPPPAGGRAPRVGDLAVRFR